MRRSSSIRCLSEVIGETSSDDKIRNRARKEGPRARRTGASQLPRSGLVQPPLSVSAHIGSCPPAGGRGAQFFVGTFSTRSTTRNSTERLLRFQLEPKSVEIWEGANSLERRTVLERHRRAPRKCWLGARRRYH